MTLISYLDQLQTKCHEKGIFLSKAFDASSVHPSIKCRTLNGKNELRFKTALAVSDAIDALAVASDLQEVQRPFREPWGLPQKEASDNACGE